MASLPLARVLAPAKVNLALNVVGRRLDGYHSLDSLVVFADLGDLVEALPADADAPPLTIEGPFAAGLAADSDNLVLRAAMIFAAHYPGAAIPPLRLEKRLPLASGIGGGSADGAATLRLLAALNGIRDEAGLAACALKLGADGPMCLVSRPLRARGIGEAIDAWDGLPDVHMVLANPGIGVSTPAVFRRLERVDNPPLPDSLPAFRDAAALAGFLASETRNDLAGPARLEAPVIATVEDRLMGSAGCLFARMSGSGATVFGLFADRAAAERAAAALSQEHPSWWVRYAALAGSGIGAVSRAG